MARAWPSRSDGLVTVTFNRPHRKNALNAANWADLDAVLREVAWNWSGKVS
jgi:2-(1,2-epoxy-1,2-dihydrophenyl)acetyl-CoA isomerase